MTKSERACDNPECQNIVPFKHIKKIKGQFYCKSCAIEIRKNHREETINNSEDKEVIKKLGRELKNNYQKQRYKKIRDTKPKNNYIPKPKGSKRTIADKNNLFISFEEKKNLYRMLLRKGIDEEEAKERVNGLVKSQNTLRMKMLNQNKSEIEIRQKMSEMLEELWNY